MTSFKYPRSARLLTGEDFQAVFNNARVKVPDQHFLLLTCPNSLGHPRIGFVVSKKNVRLAVHRNRVKRIIRENFRLNQHNLPAVDIVVLARRGLGELERSDVHKLCDRSWSKLRKKSKQLTNK